MSAETLRGMLIGLVVAAAITIAAVGSYGSGRKSIVEQCFERRAFVYGHDAWGCVRLRKRRDMESGSYNQPENL